jgi:hypothetical protein
MKLSLTFCKAWHVTIIAIHILGGIILTFASTISEKPDLLSGVIEGLAVIIFGTLCFLIYPLTLVAISIATRFAPTIALPLFIIYFIFSLFIHGKTLISHPLQSFAICCLLSAWGLFNIITAIIANRDENFNPIMLAE